MKQILYEDIMLIVSDLENCIKKLDIDKTVKSKELAFLYRSMLKQQFGATLTVNELRTIIQKDLDKLLSDRLSVFVESFKDERQTVIRCECLE